MPLNVSTPRLDAQAQMQNRPFGSNSALYRDPATQDVGNQYRRTKEEYGTARRLLRKYAKAGVMDAALKQIELRKSADASGISLGGLQRKEGQIDAVGARRDQMQQGISALSRGREAMRGGAAPAGAAAPVAAVDDFVGSGSKFRGVTPLGQKAESAFATLSESDEGKLGFRQGLDRAIGMAKTPDEMADLQRVARKAGISDEAFGKRREWWASRRRS